MAGKYTVLSVSYMIDQTYGQKRVLLVKGKLLWYDAFNFFVYGGEQVIHPRSLKELDTREIDVPYGGAKGVGQPVQKTRDVIKSVVAMMDKSAAYLLLAIENQSNIHYAMPVKNMVCYPFTKCFPGRMQGCLH